MSNLPQHRAMHNAGPYAAAIRTAHNHGSHAGHPQAAVTNHHFPCPYENKVVADGTTARMVLLFLRELLEQLLPGDEVQRRYVCPMSKCHETFPAPLQAIQHLLSCPELSSGEFNCDKCNTSHSFPTNEKDWAQWTGWRPPHPLHGDTIQRKRSLGSKMREFALRKKDPSRKQNLGFDPPWKSVSTSDTRPSTATSESPSIASASRGFFQHHLVFPGQRGQGQASGFSGSQKPVLPNGLPQVDGSMFWPGFNSTVSDLPSTASSIALSSTVDESQSERFSHNTSQTTLFGSGLGTYQQPTASAQDSNGTMVSQRFLFPTQMPYNTDLPLLPGHPPSSSAMSLDEPLPLTQSPVSASELRSAPPGGHGWWGPKVEAETPQPTPSSCGPDACFPVQAPMTGILAGGVSRGVSRPTSPCGDASPFYQAQPRSAHAMSRALSLESMQTGITTVFGTPTPERTGHAALSPHANNNQQSAAVPPKAPPESSVEDLICDECQWKPRGVRENLKGYLRKHKNTHRGVRLACDVAGCVKTFSRLDNLKKHKKDKHGIEDTGGSAPAKRAAGDSAERAEEAKPKLTGIVESDLRPATEDYSMLWPALHF